MLGRDDLVLLDVRSPGEFQHETIPGARNIPLFDNEERAQLGHIYKNTGPEAARVKGLAYALPKLPCLLEEIRKAAGRKTPLIFCWRGGLRSRNLTQAINLAGCPALFLQGGYKAFRRFINHQLTGFKIKPAPVILHGLTGTGKTLVIQSLIRQGWPALDLEGMACHRGSVFGHIGFRGKRSQKDFEALLWFALHKYQENLFIIMEKEGRRIGNIYLPPFLMEAFDNGWHILLEAPLEIRAKRIVDEYVGASYDNDIAEIIKALANLSVYLGKEKIKMLTGMIENGQYYETALILCRDYYDKCYPDARPDRYDFVAAVETSSVEKAASDIIQFLQQFLSRQKEPALILRQNK